MKAKYICYSKETYSPEEMTERSTSHLAYMDQRRTVRDFSSKPIPDEVIKNIIMAASTAPSGAHKQPWTFCVVTNQELKKLSKKLQKKKSMKVITNGCPKIGWKT